MAQCLLPRARPALPEPEPPRGPTISIRSNHQLESRMRAIRQSGSGGGAVQSRSYLIRHCIAPRCICRRFPPSVEYRFGPGSEVSVRARSILCGLDIDAEHRARIRLGGDKIAHEACLRAEFDVAGIMAAVDNYRADWSGIGVACRE